MKNNKIYNKNARFVFYDELQKNGKNILSIKRLNIIPIVDRKTKKIIDVIEFEKSNFYNLKKKQKD